MKTAEMRRGTRKATIDAPEMVNYPLRRIDPDLWKQVKERAATEGRSIRFVLLALLRLYAERGFDAITHPHHRKMR